MKLGLTLVYTTFSNGEIATHVRPRVTCCVCTRKQLLEGDKPLLAVTLEFPAQES